MKETTSKAESTGGLFELEKMMGLDGGSIVKTLVEIGINLIMAVAILVIGFWLAKVLSRAVERVMKKSNSDYSLVSFIRSLVAGIIKVLVIVTAITQLGVEMTSFVAILGAAGLAIGMAFSGTLSNFAGGVMILLFKPFKSGDFIRTQNEEGIVHEVQIFNTYLRTTDNKVIILPNGPVANGVIVNFSKAGERRVEWRFGIAYGDDLKVAKDLLQKFVDEEPRILKEPLGMIALGELANSSVIVTVRAWVKVEDYWDVFFAMNERVYNEFGTVGLTIPFPQMDVHVHNTSNE